MDSDYVFECGGFIAPLKCCRCPVEDVHGNLCGRLSTLTIPMCDHHAAASGVRIAQTRLCDAQGKRHIFDGLFACTDFKDKQMITSMHGEIIDAVEFRRRYTGLGPYTFVHGPRLIDCATVRGIGSNANTCNRGGRNNARFSCRHGNFPHLRATRSIAAGEEILVAYGSAYKRAPPVQHRTFKCTASWKNRS